jgi:hypothetical protein
MKKLMYIIVAIVILGLIASGCLPVVPPVEKDETSILTKAKPGTDFNGPHYNLNIIGKKSDWSGGGGYNNPDRHTIFVPENTDGYTTPNGLPGITIWMTQGSEFAVIDGNAFDDGEAAFELGPGTYKVYIVAKAKPAKKDEPEYYTDITGWVYAEDEFGAFYYLNIGSVHVTKSKKWKDATHIFYVSDSEDPFEIVGKDDVWVFTYMANLEAAPLYPSIEDTAYFWQYDNHGNKLVKVRFYKD